MSKKRKKISGPPLKYKVDPEDERTLILRNGLRIRQKAGLDIFLSQGKCAYALTKYGLRRRRIDYCRKRRYGQKSRNGVPNGPRYPYITFRGGTYPVHILQAEIWIGPRPKGHEVDHLNGNIDDWRLCNLQYVTCAENRRRAAILRRLRHDPSWNPKNMPQERLLQIFAKPEILLKNI